MYQNAVRNEQKAEIIVDATVGQTESINIKQVVKQGPIFRPIMCCATTLEIRKGIRNCAKMEKESKMRYGLNKTKYMMVKTWKERRGSTKKCKIRRNTQH